MRTEAQKRARKNYNKKVKRICIDIYPTEIDVKQKLEKVKDAGQPVTTYVKNLIKNDKSIDIK